MTVCYVKVYHATYDSVLRDTVLSDSVISNSMLCNSVLYDSVICDSVPCDSVCMTHSDMAGQAVLRSARALCPF